MKRYLTLLFIILLACSCRNTSINGHLDGMWQLMSIDRTDGTYTDTKEKRIYYNVKLHLMQLRQQGGSTYLGRFTQTDDSLFIYNMVLDGNNAQAATLDDLAPFGLFDTYERFGIEKLTAQRMVLRSRNALLTFRKW